MNIKYPVGIDSYTYFYFKQCIRVESTYEEKARAS